MAYELHVERDEPIADAEVLAYVEACDDLALEDGLERDTGEAVLRLAGVFIRWTAPGDEQDWVFNPGHGTISAARPEEHVLARMHAMAAHFGGRVVGDDGERYAPDGSVVPLEPDPPPAEGRRRWFGRRR